MLLHSSSSSLLFSAVSSTTGNIRFDTNHDGVTEMILSGGKLGIATVAPSANLHVNGNALITGSLGIGAISPTSNLQISGTLGFSTSTFSSNGTLSDSSFIFADTSANSLRLALPWAGNASGRIYHVKKTSPNNRLFLHAGANLIDDLSVAELTSSSNGLPFMKTISNGSQWLILSSSSHVNAAVSDNLSAWWKFNETSGSSVTDSSGGGHHGTFQGGLSFAGNGINGQLNRAMSFDGIDDHIITSDIEFGGTSPISISVWVKANAFASTRSIVSQGTQIVLRTNGTDIEFILNNFSTVDRVLVPSGMVIGQWHHIVATYTTGGDMRVYIDTADKGSVTPTGSYSNVSDNFEIGRLNCCGEYWDGAIDDLRIYNKTLSVEEINALYFSGK